MLKNNWREIRNNFYSDIEKCYCIDAWKTYSDNEEGRTIAKVYDNKEVVYLDDKAKTDSMAQRAIKEILDSQ